MKIGVCVSLDYLPFLESQGFDYLEANFSWLAGLDEEAYRKQTALLEASSLRAEAFNGFFPGGIKLYAPDGNQDDILRNVEDYCERGFARAAAWGGKVAVIGSGYVRGIPEGMTWEACDLQFARVLAVCGRVAEKYGMTVTVEPLSRNECNYIHTLSESARVAALAEQSGVRMMVDFYHYWKNGEELGGLSAYADDLVHAHYARPMDRNAPVPGDEEWLCKVAEALEKCPHIERISLECVYKPDFHTAVETARPLMEILRNVRR